MTDFAYRAYSHSFHFDPIVRSLLDTDFYKLLMLQVIWMHYYSAEVTFAMTNRTKTVKLGNDLDMAEVEWQFNHAKGLTFGSSELIWLQGQTFYGQTGIFKSAFIKFLREEFRLSEFRLGVDNDGQIIAEFSGSWWATTLWEIYSLTIVNEMRSRAKMKTMKPWELRVMYAKAEAKLIDKLMVLRDVPDLNLTDFGTRRRHSFLWQRHCVELARDVLGDKFTGTSNAYLAMTLGLEAKGTNAHELPMALSAMTMAIWGNSPDYDDRLRDAQYEVLRIWEKTYDGALKVFLPDTFGTTQFLKNAPKFLVDWVGARPDSKNPYTAGEELISWWESRGQDPKEKLIIFSDGLDVTLSTGVGNGANIVDLAQEFRGRVRVGFGWGTNLTNDFIGCHPHDPNFMNSISLVCKVKSANGCPAVKLSDNYNKATGPADKVEEYRNVFGTEGQDGSPVMV